MKTLILGHGRNYKRKDIRCSPINIDEWYDFPYDCVDMSEEVKPDIVFTIRLGEKFTFAKDNSYDRIIDCTGGAISGGRIVPTQLLKEYKRILKPNGVVYTNFRVIYTLYKREDGKLLKIKK